MNIRKLSFILICILFAVAPFQSNAFMLKGEGKVLNDEVGVTGELVDYYFSYNLSDFVNNSFSQNVASYYAFSPIPVKITGSISGAFSRVDPISRVVVLDNLSGTNYDVWNFTVSGGRHSSEALGAKNLSSDEFNSPLPNSFADAHDIFFPQHANKSVWTQDSSGIFFTNNGTEKLLLGDLHWEIVPAPTSFLLVAAGLLIICFFHLISRHGFARKFSPSWRRAQTQSQSDTFSRRIRP